MAASKTILGIPFLALLAGGVAIGFAGIFMRLSDVNPIASAFWRMAIASPLLWIWALAPRGQEHEQKGRTGFSAVLALSGAFFAGDLATWHLSLHYTTVSNATLLSNLAPLVIAAWMWVVHRARFTRVFIAGLIVALLGAMLLAGPNIGSGDAAGRSRMLGDALGLASAVFYAAYQLAVKSARSEYDTARLMAWSTTVTALALLPLALLAPGAFWPAHASGWLPLLALALVAQIGGQTIIAYAFAHLPASLASVSLLIQPLTATAAAWLIFGEAVGPWQLAGAMLLLWGIYLSTRGA